MKKKKVALLTAGGLAPCLSSAVAGLTSRYFETLEAVEIICYRNGYQGMLQGDAFRIKKEDLEHIGALHEFGGSPLGNSRVKLTNIEDCIKRGLVLPGEDPQAVAAKRLIADGIDILHTIGGDDTNTAAGHLADFLKQNGHQLTVVGLPKTIDNDVVPIAHSLGASTAAEAGAIFFEHIVTEHTAHPKTLIIHEVMGRNCGWLTAATAWAYHQRLKKKSFYPQLGFAAESFRIHGVYIPEKPIDIAQEAKRLKVVMESVGNVNIFVSEGAGVDSIVQDMQARGEVVPQDAFGHFKLDHVNVGQWLGKQLASLVGAEKVLVQKSGYFARSAPANAEDLRLIQSCVDRAVEGALKGESGVVGHDEEHGGLLRIIEFKRIKGGKAFRFEHASWFEELLHF